MSRIKYISLILILLALPGCTLDKAGTRHLPTIGQLADYPYGGWIQVNYQGVEESSALLSLSGELITCQDDALFVLDSLGMHVIPFTSVHQATLYIYKTQPGVFAAVAVIFMIPNIVAAIVFPEYAGQFLALAIVPFVTGTIFTATEVSTKRNRLFYPERNPLNEFVKFARFPQGMPEGFKIED
jgi:hypothetical protein